MRWLVELILKSAAKEYSKSAKSFATLWGFFVFELAVPTALVGLGLVVERTVGIDRLLNLRFEVDLAWRLGVFVPLLCAGQILVVWTAIEQLRFSGGTPAFRVPPRRLLVRGPFRLCRNPMVVGYLAYYYGLAFLFASPVALFGLVPALHLFALWVIVEVEEVELEQRFGDDYRNYKKRVNRMLPLPPRFREEVHSRESGSSSPSERGWRP